MLLMGEAGHIVNGVADGAHWRIRGERQRSRCAVHTDEPTSGFDHVFKVAAVDEMEPAFEAQSPGMMPNEALPVVEAGIERMCLEQQMELRSGMCGKALDDVACCALHVRERGVGANLIIARKLER